MVQEPIDIRPPRTIGGRIALLKAGVTIALKHLHEKLHWQGSNPVGAVAKHCFRWRSVGFVQLVPSHRSTAPHQCRQTARHVASVESEDHRPFGGRRMAVTRSALAAVL